MRLSLLSSFFILISAIFVAPTTGQAAPQILGLVASNAPLPLTCENGTCSVEISAVCLQENRKAPVPGTAYKMVEGSQLTLNFMNAQGLKRSLPVAKLVDLKSLRVFTSVQVTLPERIVRDLGGHFSTASLTVGPLSSALPMSQPGDENPLTRSEIRAFTGLLRKIAEGVIGRDTNNREAAGILNQMVNRLPSDNSVGAESISTLRQQTVSPTTEAKKPETVRIVDRALDTCRETLRIERTPHLRACLSNQHDILSTETTRKIWRSLRPVW